MQFKKNEYKCVKNGDKITKSKYLGVNGRSLKEIFE